MSKENGFLQLRRGLWEHVRDGSLTHTGAIVYIYMLSQADTRTGVWKGSAQCIATALDIPRSTAKYALKGLDGRYIKRFTVPGRHVCYPILLHKFLVTQGQHIGLMLDALNTTDARTLEFHKPVDDRQVVQQVVQDIVQDVGPQRRSENRNKRQEKKQNPAAKPAPPADPRFQPLVTFAHKTFEEKHKVKPSWLGKDFEQLRLLLKANASLDGEELERRWRNYLDSTEPFTSKQGDSLGYFASHCDTFSNGPISQSKGKANGDASSALKTTIGGFLENFQRNN